MRTIGIRLLALLPLCAAVAAAADEDGWVTLLDGSGLHHWNRTGDANWRVVDGAAQADAGSGYLVTKEPYDDFEIRAEFWVDESANSGIFIRCDVPGAPDPFNCYEVNIFDTRPQPAYGTGAIVDVAPIEKMEKAGGRWNTYEIAAVGERLVVKLNGRTTVDVHDDAHASGPIALQYGSGVVKFRKVEIRPL